MTVTGAFTGESSIREFFDMDDFGDVIAVTYTPSGGSPVASQVFCTNKTPVAQPDVMGGTVGVNYFEVIVGRDHVSSPKAGDIMTVTDPNQTGLTIGNQIRIVGTIESDGQTAMMYGELV